MDTSSYPVMAASKLPERRHGVFTRAEALSYGWSDRRIRSPEFMPLLHGVYCRSDMSVDHNLLCEAASLVLPPDAIVTGRSAATLRGVPLAKTWDRIEVLVSGAKYMNRRRGLRCWSVRSAPFEHDPWCGIRVATPLRAALDLLAQKPLHRAVAAVDALLRSGAVRLPELTRYLGGRSDRGIRRANTALQYLDSRAESPPESELRVLLTTQGIDVVPQAEVHDGPSFVARVDLAVRRRRVAVEYDGSWHGEPAQFARDQARLRRLKQCGWTVVVVTARDLYDSPTSVVTRVKAAMATSA